MSPVMSVPTDVLTVIGFWLEHNPCLVRFFRLTGVVLPPGCPAGPGYGTADAKHCGV